MFALLSLKISWFSRNVNVHCGGTVFDCFMFLDTGNDCTLFVLPFVALGRKPCPVLHLHSWTAE